MLKFKEYLIEAKEGGLPREKQRLIFHNVELNDNRKLWDYKDIVNGSIVLLIPKTVQKDTGGQF